MELVFSSSSMRGEAICRDINITNDLFVESDETFTVGLMPVDDAVNGSSTLPVTIRDNDGKVMSTEYIEHMTLCKILCDPCT